jgi:hypothetical protein
LESHRDLSSAENEVYEVCEVYVITALKISSGCLQAIMQDDTIDNVGRRGIGV